MKKSFKEHNKKFTYLANVENQDFIADLIVKGNYRSLLDLGCYHGTLIANLRQRGWTGLYTGVDVDPLVLEKAKEKNPNEFFVYQDVLNLKVNLTYDIVVLGGVFVYMDMQEAQFVLDSIKNKISKTILFHDVFRCKNGIYKHIKEKANMMAGEFMMKNAAHNKHRKFILLSY